MRRAILWLDENGGVFAAVAIVVLIISIMLGMVVVDLLGWEHSTRRLIQGAVVGDAIILTTVGALWGVGAGWSALVSWAKAPPCAPKLAAPRASGDPFLIEALREVEQLVAPEGSE